MLHFSYLKSQSIHIDFRPVALPFCVHEYAMCPFLRSASVLHTLFLTTASHSYSSLQEGEISCGWKI